VLGEKPVPVPFSPPQISGGLPWIESRLLQWKPGVLTACGTAKSRGYNGQTW